MTTVVIAPRFVSETSAITSDRLYDRIWSDVHNLAYVPNMGSDKQVPDSVKARYGHGIRAIPIAPFLVVYRYDQDSDECLVLGLMFQRQAY